MSRYAPSGTAQHSVRFLYLSLALIVVAMLLGAWGLRVTPLAASAPATGLGACGNTGIELLGFSDALDKARFGGFDVSELSGIAYSGKSDVYYAVADRAGTVPSHVFRLEIPITGARPGVPFVADVIVLKDESGSPFTGASFDGEGIVVLPDGRMLVASEGGSAAGEQPEIRLFSPAGEHLGELPIPERFLIGTNNLSFESLTLSPRGQSIFLPPGRRSLFTANEAPLTRDGRTDDLRSRVRVLRFAEHAPGAWSPAGEYYYLTEPGRTADDVGVVELIALSEERLLVLERGFVAGQGNTIRLFLVSLDGAADISHEATLSAPGLVPLSKTLILDLSQCPPGDATVPAGATQVNPLLDNFEGMALGPRLPDGRRALLLISDDNGSASQTTRIVALAVPESAPGW